jgi:hypothetical protein
MRQNCAEAAGKLAIDSLERCMCLFGTFWHHEKVFKVRGFELCHIFRGGEPTQHLSGCWQYRRRGVSLH